MSNGQEDTSNRPEANVGRDSPQGQGGPPATGPAELRRRLRKGMRTRHGGPADDRKPASAVEPIVFGRDLPRRATPRPHPPAAPGEHMDLADAVSGVEAAAPGGSRAYLIERRLVGPDGQRAKLCDSLADALAEPASGARAQLAAIGLGEAPRLEDVIFIDLETTGLGSTPLFLIGAMVWDAAGLVVRQLFARDYSEERAALELFVELAAAKRLLVSFNGKSFDLPYLRMRAAANSVGWQIDPPHLDLLHASRRVWKRSLPDCRLQTLERLICGRMRSGDIPGHLIPEAYHAYVRSGNAAQMADVLEHNFLDLVTLADLLVRLPAGG